MPRYLLLALSALMFTVPLGGEDSSLESVARWNGFLREQADVSALFAAGLSEDQNHPGALDFFTEALLLLPEGERWDVRRAEYTRRLGKAVEALENIKGIESEDRRYLREAAEEFTKRPSKKRPGEAVGFHPLRLKTIIVPKIEFKDTPFLDALDQIENWSRELDPEGVGLDINVEEGIMSAPDSQKVAIFLRLYDVPLDEALRYTCSLAQTRYMIEDHSIRVERITSHSSELPTFSIPVEGPAFAPVSGNVKGHLEERGFSFPHSGSAVYSHEKRELFVKVLESQIPGIVLWLRREGALRDEEDVYLRGIARIARAKAYEKETLLAASENRYREALGYFAWLEKNVAALLPSVKSGLSVVPIHSRNPRCAPRAAA